MWLLYWRLVGARMRAQMQYKVSFWMDMLGLMLVTGLEFSVIAILFTRFQSLGGWGGAQSTAGAELLRGAGASKTSKSPLLLFVSVQPLPLRTAAFVVESGPTDAPSKSVTVVPQPT